MVAEHEAARRVRFDWIIKSRPDLSWLQPGTAYALAPGAADWFFVLPRPLMEPVLHLWREYQGVHRAVLWPRPVRRLPAGRRHHRVAPRPNHPARAARRPAWRDARRLVGAAGALARHAHAGVARQQVLLPAAEHIGAEGRQRGADLMDQCTAGRAHVRTRTVRHARRVSLTSPANRTGAPRPQAPSRRKPDGPHGKKIGSPCLPWRLQTCETGAEAAVRATAAAAVVAPAAAVPVAPAATDGVAGGATDEAEREGRDAARGQRGGRHRRRRAGGAAARAGGVAVGVGGMGGVDGGVGGRGKGGQPLGQFHGRRRPQSFATAIRSLRCAKAICIWERARPACHHLRVTAATQACPSATPAISSSPPRMETCGD